MTDQPTPVDTPTLKPCQRAGLVTAMFTALATFALQVLPFLTAAADWAAGTGGVPDLNVLRSAAVALVYAAVAGLLNFAYRCAQSRGWINLGRGVDYLPPARN